MSFHFLVAIKSIICKGCITTLKIRVVTSVTLVLAYSLPFEKNWIPLSHVYDHKGAIFHISLVRLLYYSHLINNKNFENLFIFMDV